MNSPHGTRSLRELLRILFQHWFMLLFMVLLIGGGTLAYCLFYATPVYRSRIELVFQRPANKNPLAAENPERALEVFVKGQQQILMSDLVMARTKVVAETPTLCKQWYALRTHLEESQRSETGGGNSTGAADMTATKDVSAVQAQIDAFLEGSPDKSDTVAGRVKALLERGQRELNKFRKSIELETPGGEHVAMTESFAVLVDRPGPKERPDSHLAAQRVADILADMYMVRQRQLDSALSDPAVQVMQTVVNKVNREVEQKRGAYEQFVNEHSADIGVLEQLLKSGTEHGIQIMLTRVREADARLQLDLAKVKAIRDVTVRDLPGKLIAAASDIPPAKAGQAIGVEAPGSTPVYEGTATPDIPVASAAAVEALTEPELDGIVENVSAELLESNVVVREMKHRLGELESHRAELLTKFTHESRNVIYTEDEIKQVKRQAVRAIVAHANGLRVSIRAYEEQIAENSRLLERIAARQNEITRSLAQYSRLKSDMETSQKQLDEIKAQHVTAEANSVRARQAATIDKLSEASVPDRERPLAPRPIIYTAIAFVVSLLLGLGMAFLADHFDHTLRSIHEAERYLGVPVVGSVKKRGRGLVLSK